MSVSADEYSSLRDEMLRADDHAIQLTGFSLVAATFLAVAVIDTENYATRALLLIGFNVIILTLVLKVREKRGQQGRIAAYIRVFHESGVGWESRVHRLRLGEKEATVNPWGNHDPRALGRRAVESFTKRASVGEFAVFATLSIFAFLALPLGFFFSPSMNSPMRAITILLFVASILLQGSITGFVLWASRTFGQLERNSETWERTWMNVDKIEALRRRLATSEDIILINGGPASGKTSLGESLRSVLGLELVSKDDLKQGMYDDWKRSGHVVERGPGDWTISIPGSSPRDSRDRAALDWLDDEASRALVEAADVNRPCIVDTNVAARQRELFQTLAPRLVEIKLVAESEVLLERYNSRPQRHPVHEPRASGVSAAWGGTDSLQFPGVTTIEVRTDVDEAEKLDDPVQGLERVLTLLASHYGA